MYLISTLIAYIETYEFISCKVGHVEIQNATQKVLYNLIKSLVWSKKDQNRARNSLRVYVSDRKYCHNITEGQLKIPHVKTVTIELAIVKMPSIFLYLGIL